MIPRALLVSFVISLLILGGCTTARTPAERIEQNRAAFDGWPAEVQQRVRAGEVAVGFTPEQVRLALGEPHDTTTRTTSEGVSEIWTYRDRSPRLGFGIGVGGGSGGTGVGVGLGTSTGGTQAPRLRVVFTDGVVSAVEQAR